MIELTEQQRQALQAENPPRAVDPCTRETYVLVRQADYERVAKLLREEQEQAEAIAEIAPGILRSQQAFWRDLPQLLAQKKLRKQWVCYHGDERVGIGVYEDLIRECLRRGFTRDTYDLFVIEPHYLPPWAIEEIEGGGHEFDEEEDFEEPGQPA